MTPDKTRFISGPPVVSILGDGKYRLEKPFHYVPRSRERVVIVPIGFESDLASVPRIPVIFAAYGGRGSWAAIIHDYLCHQAQDHVPDRRIADEIFLEALQDAGMSQAEAWPMYIAVQSKTTAIRDDQWANEPESNA